MRQGNAFSGWEEQFRKVITEYQKNRISDPFMTWFREKDSENFFSNDFERVLVILIDARFDQKTTAENALQNTVKVVELGVLKRLIPYQELPLLIPRQNKTAEEWTKLFSNSLSKLHELAQKIVAKTKWDAEELIDFMLASSNKVPYLAEKTSRLAVRWLYELIPNLKIDMGTYKVPIDSLLYRVSCRLGIINPEFDKYNGAGSLADVKIQSFAKKIFSSDPWLLDEPLWSSGRSKYMGGHCFPINPNCNGCIFESICPKKFLDILPEKVGMNI